MYNGQIVFAVPESKVSLAIGKGAEHVKRLREIIGKRIKVVAMPEKDDRNAIGKFVEAVVEPIECNKVEVRDGSLILHAGRQNKAALIGRNRMREQELAKVLEDFFGITEFRIN
jgi:transcription antitermination factor NusA-like protein